jgi:hypothetical protein
MAAFGWLHSLSVFLYARAWILTTNGFSSVLEVISGKIHGWLCELIECLINLTISCSVYFFFAAPLCCFCVCLLDVTCLFVSSKTVLLVTFLLDATSVCASARYVCFCDECEETGAVVHSPVFCPFLANVNRWLLRCRWLANGGEQLAYVCRLCKTWLVGFWFMRKFLDCFFTCKFERFCAGSGTARSRIGVKNADECICVSWPSRFSTSLLLLYCT